MATIPRDVHDLYLAPVALAVDGLLEELGRLDQDELVARIHSDSRLADGNRAMREAGLIQTLRLDTETHGWELTVEDRGVRLTHSEHSFVLGLPSAVRSFLESAPAGTAAEPAAGDQPA